MKTALLLAASLTFFPAASIIAAPTTELVSSGFKKPVWAESPKGEANRLWVVEKEGTIRIFNTKDGSKSDFLDIQEHINIRMNEQGLLGFAFDPNFLKNGRFYAYYTNTKGDTEVCRFTAEGETKNKCRADTRELLLTFKQDFPNHNGGWIGIGPDGYLHISTGDGGAANDPKQRSQDLSSYLGKILRIDVSPRKGYKIPKDNPFKSRSSAKPEIFAYGLRNPWRCSWDAKTGDFYIADVGQNRWEEINFISAGKTKGSNFGWRLREGLIATPRKKVGGDKPRKAIDPVHVYDHGTKDNQGLSITGGYVYRGPIKSLQGHYFYADYANPRIWSFNMKAGKAVGHQDWTNRFKHNDKKIRAIASFGQDHAGNLLIISHGGNVYRVVDK